MVLPSLQRSLWFAGRLLEGIGEGAHVVAFKHPQEFAAHAAYLGEYQNSKLLISC